MAVLMLSLFRAAAGFGRGAEMESAGGSDRGARLESVHAPHCTVRPPTNPFQRLCWLCGTDVCACVLVTGRSSRRSCWRGRSTTRQWCTSSASPRAGPPSRPTAPDPLPPAPSRALSAFFGLGAERHALTSAAQLRLHTVQ
eukprot:57683-Rhodomonas_salina.2